MGGGAWWPGDPRDGGHAAASRQAREVLAGRDLRVLARARDLTMDDAGRVGVPVLGRGLQVCPGGLCVTAEDGGAVSPLEERLALRYLSSLRAAAGGGGAVAIREVVRGRPELEGLAVRDACLLLDRFGDFPETLEQAAMGIAGAHRGEGGCQVRVPAVATHCATVRWRLGPEPVLVSVMVLVDRSLAGVYAPADVSALGHCLCLRLARPAAGDGACARRV